MLIEWRDDYELGIPKVDNQHKRLVELINQLDIAYRQKKGRSVAEKIFLNLTNYTNYHFATEELVMRKHQYHRYEIHKNNHDAFVKQVQVFNQRLLSGDEFALSNTINYLNGWLIEHIMVEDKKYSDELGDKFTHVQVGK